MQLHECMYVMHFVCIKKLTTPEVWVLVEPIAPFPGLPRFFFFVVLQFVISTYFFSHTKPPPPPPTPTRYSTIGVATVAKIATEMDFKSPCSFSSLFFFLREDTAAGIFPHSSIGQVLLDRLRFEYGTLTVKSCVGGSIPIFPMESPI